MLKKYVICIYETDYITKGKIYEVLEETPALYYTILNDRNQVREYVFSRFKNIDPKREDWGVQMESA